MWGYYIYDEIVHFIQAFAFFILSLTETHLVENIENSEIIVKQYECARNDSDTKHTEGVLAYLNM